MQVDLARYTPARMRVAHYSTHADTRPPRTQCPPKIMFFSPPANPELPDERPRVPRHEFLVLSQISPRRLLRFRGFAALKMQGPAAGPGLRTPGRRWAEYVLNKRYFGRSSASVPPEEGGKIGPRPPRTRGRANGADLTPIRGARSNQGLSTPSRRESGTAAYSQLKRPHHKRA